MFKGLSTNQAPPISVPLRFFLTAPIFAILISFVIFAYPNEVFDRYSPIGVGVVHLFTLGILVMIIFGALQQMLPVLAGVVFPNPKKFATIIHTFLILGTLSLSGSFIFSLPILLKGGVVFLALSFGVFFYILAKLLFQVKFLTSTVKAMQLFTIGGIITFVLGLFLASSHILENILPIHLQLINSHILFASFTFIVILIMGVAFQVIPMFYVAKEFPKILQDRFPKIILSLVAISAIFMVFGLDWLLAKFIIASHILIFSYFGLQSLNNRRRAVFDITLWYWKISFYALGLSMILWFEDVSYELFSIIFIFGFIYPLLQGMIYKIIPFLSWFHLSAKGHFMIPNLKEYIKDDIIKIQFFIYLFSFLFFILSIYMGELFLYIASAFFLVSNLLFLINLLTATQKYNAIIKS